MPYAPEELLTRLLRDVSRSFYLTLRVLPRKIRRQIGSAYLLARTTDTIADTELVALDQRMAALQALRQRIAGETQEKLEFGELSRRQASPAEAALLQQTEASLALLDRMAESDRSLIRQVLQTITSGQELDLKRFGSASRERVLALQSAPELDDYTFRVAGCVGEFWTKLCRAHLFPHAPLDMVALVDNGVRFGKGLQLVNILRDLPGDLNKGRCYLPEEDLSTGGLKPPDLRQPTNEPKLRPIYDAWLERAEGHLVAGWKYTRTLPRGCMRLRLACAWPLLIGFKTLALLRTAEVLNPNHRVKVSRSEVRRLMLRSVLLYPWPDKWDKLFQNAASSSRGGNGSSPPRVVGLIP